MLIANPRAGSVSPRVREVIAKALAADFKLEAHVTRSRAHAMDLSAQAVSDGFEAVFVFGGDGTVNEAAQPLVGTGVALGILPGGTTNVLANSLGIPVDPVEATAFLASHLRSGTKRRIGVGSVGDRYFLFTCGIGLDAEVVKRVEQEVEQRGRKSHWTFLKYALAVGSTDYRTTDGWLTVRPEDEEPYKAMMSIVCNAWPFTYFKGRPVDACPGARLDSALDLLSLERLRAITIPRIAWSVLVSRSHVRWKRTHYHHDISKVMWTADQPRPVQVDGDYIGEWGSAELHHHPEALDLLV